MQNLYITQMDDCQFIFDYKYQLITNWFINDAYYRSEYMDRLMKHLGYDVIHLSYNHKNIIDKVKNVMMNFGYSEEDFVQLDLLKIMNNLYEELIEYAESRVKNSCFTIDGSVQFDYNYFTTGTPAIEMAEFMYEKTLCNLNPTELARFVWCVLERHENETPLSDTFRGMTVLD